MTEGEEVKIVQISMTSFMNAPLSLFNEKGKKVLPFTLSESPAGDNPQ